MVVVMVIVRKWIGARLPLAQRSKILDRKNAALSKKGKRLKGENGKQKVFKIVVLGLIKKDDGKNPASIVLRIFVDLPR